MRRLATLLSRPVPSHRATGGEHSRRALFLEQLDERRLLAAVSWDGGGGDFDWNNAANWSGNVLPGASDDVTINVAGDATIVHASGAAGIRSLVSTESIDWSGSLSLTAASTVSGQFNNSGTVEVLQGGLHLANGGTSSGAFIAAAGTGLNIWGGHVLLLSNSL